MIRILPCPSPDPKGASNVRILGLVAATVPAVLSAVVATLVAEVIGRVPAAATPAAATPATATPVADPFVGPVERVARAVQPLRTIELVCTIRFVGKVQWLVVVRLVQ